MIRPAVLILAMLVLVVSFQNCGNTVPTGSSIAKLETSAREIPLVDVQPVTKTDPLAPTTVLLEGYFSSGCPATLEAQFDSDEAGTSHVIRAHVISESTPGMACTQALVPFQQELSLGNLPRGDHRIQFLSEDGPKALVLQID